MDDTTTGVKITLEATDRASPVVENLRRSIKGLQRDLSRSFKFSGISGLDVGRDAKRIVDLGQRVARQHAGLARAEDRSAARSYTAVARRFQFQARMARQQMAEQRQVERARSQAESANLRAFRQRLAFADRMRAQRAAEERAGEREHLARVRRLEREQGVARRAVSSRTRDALTSSRGAFDAATRPPAIAAVAGAAATAAAARRILSAESDVDAAEISARAYGGLSKDAARALRKEWASPLAEQLGSTTTALLRSYVEATKVGIPSEGARAFAALATQASEAWEVPFGRVVDTLGTVNSILTSSGKAFDFKKLSNVANTIQHLSAKMSTTPERLISFLQRGAGAAELLGMSQEAGLAFGSASTSLGNQPAESGRMFDYVASRLIELPRLTRKKGDEGDQARALIRQLGYGSAGNVEKLRRENPDEFLFDFIERFGRIENARKRDESIRWFSGREWLGEFGRMVTGVAKVREAQKLAKEAKGLDAIGEVWALHQTKLVFVSKQFKAGFLNILGEFGTVLSPIARQVGDYFLRWSQELRSGGLQARLKAALEGFVEGLGFKDVPDLLKGILGDPGEGSAGAVESWRAAARGFASGLREVATAIVTAFKALSGGSSDPEVIGRWTARILGFSAAMKAASPALGIVEKFGSAILAIANTILAAWSAITIARAAAGIGAAGAAAGAGVALAGAAAMPLTVVVAGLAGIAALAVTIVNWSAIRDWFGGWTRSGTPDASKSPIERGKPDLRWWEVDPLLHRQSLDGGDTVQTLMRKASLDTSEELVGGVRDLTDELERFGASIRLAALGPVGRSALDGRGPLAAFGVSPSAGTSGSRAFTPKVQVPGWLGISRSGSGAGASSRGVGGSAMLDAISRAEGTTRDGYEAVLGNGRYGRPDKPLTSMSLAEAFAFGRTIKARHGSSSAIGRYQIVGNTMRDAAGALGLDWNATRFDPATQDRMAKWIASTQGLGAWEGFKKHPRERAAAAADMAKGSAGATSGSAFTGGPGDFSGLRIKSREAIAGGPTHSAITSLARSIQEGGVAGGLNRFTGFNDRYHAGTRSKHASGLATDFTILDPSRSREAAEDVRKRFRGAGLTDDMFRVIDEYRNPSGRSTGGHIHAEFRNALGASRFAEWAARQKALAEAAKPQVGLGATPGAPALGKALTTPQDLADGVPLRRFRGDDIGPSRTGMTMAGVPSVTVNVTGGSQSPQELASAIGRQVSQAWSHRTHDVDAELA